MTDALWVTGDTLEVLRQLPDSSIDLVVTSPPFLALRSYLPADDPAKAHEIGQEATPGAFLDVLLDITEELARVLAPHGSIAIELGDTYSGSGGGGGDYAEGGMRDGQPAFGGSASKRRHRHDRGDASTSQWKGSRASWPLDKSLTMVPELYRLALAYGFNPLTGRQTDPWRIRNVVRWCRPNPTVGALSDKFRPATSDLVIACKSTTRWFDLDAVRTPNARADETCTNGDRQRAPERFGERETNDVRAQNPAGSPPLDWWDDAFDQDAWEIATAPYKGSHYATYPPRLVERPVKAMCPTEVCTTCGEPRRRITGEPTYIGTDSGEPIEPESWASFAGDTRHKRSGGMSAKNDGRTETATRVTTTIGWTDCGHGTWRPGRVLDPFAGSGTTLAVATGHARDAIGIDLDQRNAALALERIGPMWFQQLNAGQLAERLAPAVPDLEAAS